MCIPPRHHLIYTQAVDWRADRQTNTTQYITNGDFALPPQGSTAAAVRKDCQLEAFEAHGKRAEK